MADTQTESDPLLAFRDRFPITQRSNYLINNSLGAMPKATRDSVGRFLDEWDTRGVRSWGDGWWTLQDEVGDQVATVLGVRAGTVSMHQNIAVALEMMLSCFRFDGKRNGIVYADRNFPSDQYIYEARAAHGAKLTRVPAASDGISTDGEQVAAAIDDSTLLVAIDHVMFRSSSIVDVAPIVEKARKVGAFVILDTFHSVGTQQLELEKLGVHAAVGGALKWLCGGPGNCFLYVHPDEANKLTPAFTGWAAHKQPFLFSPDGQDYRDDGGRFATGTPNVPALYAGKEGIATVVEAGLDNVRRRSQELTTMLVDEAQQHGLGLKSPLDAARRGGHVALDVPHGYAVCQALSQREIVVDFRPDAGLRVAPHFYNTREEVRTCVQAIPRDPRWRRAREVPAAGAQAGMSGDGRRIWDVSEPIEPATATFPGDNAFSQQWVMRMADGASCNVSTIRMSVHVGTHTDAPLHYADDGSDMAGVGLQPYLGRCRVADVRGEGTPSLIPAAALTDQLLDGVERILFRTGETHDHRRFDSGFTSLGGEAATVLAERGIQLVGIDTPSMDHASNRELDGHQALYRGRVAILENLDLTGVPVGDYELIALPLRIVGCDSSPVRAILRELP